MESKPLLYVFDLDWTLIKSNPEETKYIHSVDDEPIIPTVHLFNQLCASNTDVAVLTGRKSKDWSDVTIDWMNKYTYSKEKYRIILQPEPTQKNHIFKEQVLRKLLEEYTIIGMFDDNPAMVDVCKRLGIRLYLCT